MQATRLAALRWTLTLCCVLSLAALAIKADAKPNDKNQLEAMADALKYLQQLDKYYSQVARPSPRSEQPRSAGELTKVENTLKMLQLQALDRFYSGRTRPRFGKRADLNMMSDDILPEDSTSEQLWRRLVNRR
ncbi:neuropeptide F [Anabrus simplex]|uniref:neuropeptide F n=1 Tax=Anabrus simplex TaxID=316456 RepID=UPI0035A355BA